MNIKKIEFSEQPSLIVNEGAVVRINFDVEQSEKETEGDETVIVYLAHVIRVPQPMTLEGIKAVMMAEGYNEYKADSVAAEVMMNIVQGYGNTEAALGYAKQKMIADISAYDDSEAVNQFTYEGVPMWLDSTLRTKLDRRFDAEIAKGKTDTTIHIVGLPSPLVLPLTVGKVMMTELENYASECYEATEGHKASVSALTTISEVLAYDYTTGYPEHPAFTEQSAE